MINGFNRNGSHQPDADQSGAEQRVHLRTGMLVTAGLRLPDDAEFRQVRIRNLSEQGLMAEVGVPVAVGTPVSVELPGVGVVDGSVAWSTEGRIGVALVHPIDIALVNAARSAN